MTLTDRERTEWDRGLRDSSPGQVRCECVGCGAHIVAQTGYRLAGQCGNCGSYELRTLDAAATRPVVGAGLAAVRP